MTSEIFSIVQNEFLPAILSTIRAENRKDTAAANSGLRESEFLNHSTLEGTTSPP
jgi:hypothetical protein